MTEQEPESVFQNRTDLTALSEAVSRIRSELSKVIVGQVAMVDQLIAALLSNGHVLIEGVLRNLGFIVLALLFSLRFLVSFGSERRE